MQLNHYNSNFKKQNFPITLVCDNVTNAPNIGSLFRVADAFNIEKIIFCGSDIQIGKRVKKTSRTTEKYVTFQNNQNIDEVITDLKAKDYLCIALEITNESYPLSKFELKDNQPIALIIGNENFGITQDILKMVNKTIHINMYGENTSMNVVQATSITLYEITKQLQNL